MPTTDILNHSLETLQPTVAIPTPAAPSLPAATTSPVAPTPAAPAFPPVAAASPPAVPSSSAAAAPAPAVANIPATTDKPLLVYSRRPTPPQPATSTSSPPPSSPPYRTRSITGRLPPPIDKLNLSAVISSPLPYNYLVALRDPAWRQAMQEEYDALMHNNTWSLVPPPPGANIVSGK
jgi:histone deacetylase 1/2